MGYECPNCQILVVSDRCAQCGAHVGDAAVLEPVDDYPRDLGTQWEARDQHSRYDIDPLAGAPAAVHAYIESVEEVSTGSSGGGFLSRFAPLRISGVVSQVDQPRSETVGLGGHNAARMAASGCLTVPFRAMGLLMGILFRPLRFLVLPSMRFQGQQGPDQLTIPVNTFLLKAHDGRSVECMIRGELRGGALRQGDDVDVEGRLDGQGVLKVSNMVHASTGAVTSAYVDPRARGGSMRAVLACGVLVIMIVYLAKAFG